MGEQSDPELVNDFIVECNEGLDRLDGDLVTLESQPDDRATVDQIFRTLHTIKGNSSFFGFEKLELVAHAAENLLTELSAGRLGVTSETTTTLLLVVDAIREILLRIEHDQTEGDGDYRPLLSRLEAIQQQGDAPSATRPDKTPLDLEGNRFGAILIHRGFTTRENLDAALTLQNQGDPRHLGEILVEQGNVRPEHVVEALHEFKDQQAMMRRPRTIRIGVDLLDKLMDLGEELIPATDQLLKSEVALRKAMERVTDLMQALRAGVVRTRMQRISELWDRFPRVVRDLALSCGKQVGIEMEGSDTELDKSIVEALKDPMTHIIRNAIDHGIESPEQRVEAGKPAKGCLILRASREGRQTIIEVCDDGAGINTERVRQKALDRKLITPEQAEAFDEAELISLIFTPGFSTAEEVSHISGRGVGMDVVKFSIEQVGGKIEIESERGKGSKFRICFP